ACSPVPTVLTGTTSPGATVQAAGKNPLGGAEGKFILTVKAVGFTEGKTFLDSEANYRDRNNLAVAMSDHMAKEVAKRLGTPIKELKNRRIVVQGVAKRVRVYYLNRNHRYT